MQVIKKTPVAIKIALSKGLIWALGLGLIARLVYLAVTDQMGANPVEFIERSTGLWSLVFLLLSLSITPVRLVFKQAWCMALRRLLGVWMFALACLHLLSYLWLDYAFNWGDISQDILKHPYVIVGLFAWLISVPLAITSTQVAIRRLKQRWKTLHQLVYLIAILALLHFLWLVKKDISEPVIYIVVFITLMSLRLTWVQRCLRQSSP